MAVKRSLTRSIRLETLPFAPKCRACHLASDDYPKHPGIGTTWVQSTLPPGTKDTPAPHPALLLVGQNPGQGEDIENLPFVGASGFRVHHAYIPGAHLHTLAACYLSNAARCCTLENATPPARTFKACLPLHMGPDLDTLACSHEGPLYILMLGGPATSHLYKFLTGVKDVSLTKAFAQQGTPALTPGGYDCVLFATYHPAFVMRSANMRFAVQDHLEILRSHLEGRAPTPSKPRIVPPCYPQDFAALHTPPKERPEWPRRPAQQPNPTSS